MHGAFHIERLGAWNDLHGALLKHHHTPDEVWGLPHKSKVVPEPENFPRDCLYTLLVK